MFGVIFETPWSTKILFEGTSSECIQFIESNPEFCDDSVTHIEELEYA
jgi:hypothetical protein